MKIEFRNTADPWLRLKQWFPSGKRVLLSAGLFNIRAGTRPGIASLKGKKKFRRRHSACYYSSACRGYSNKIVRHFSVGARSSLWIMSSVASFGLDWSGMREEFWFLYGWCVCSVTPGRGGGPLNSSGYTWELYFPTENSHRYYEQTAGINMHLFMDISSSSWQSG